jgi:RHS repeat-associated protein
VSYTHTNPLRVSGSTTVPVTNLTVNGMGVTPYQDNAFGVADSADRGANVIVITAPAQDVYGRSSTNTVSVTVVPTNSAYSYDLNGNLLTDGTRNFTYDDENELISVWQANVWSNNFAYDGKLRRRIAREYAWAGSSGWQLTNEVHYMYDGNLVVQERNGANLPQVSYTRGIDLSGSLQGAGGIGGLLARTDNTRLVVADPFASAYYHCDGNGNVTCLMTSYQQLAAKYLYDPYGNLLAMYGSLAGANTYRFSSKEWDGNAGLYYYGYRFYDPNLQRWVNRDPLGDFGSTVYDQVHIRHLYQLSIDEQREANAFKFVYDNPISVNDLLGLQSWMGPGYGAFGPATNISDLITCQVACLGA